MASSSHISFVVSIITVITLLAVSQVDIVSSFSVSVPPVRSVCKSMHPGHDKYKAQKTDSPFLVSTDVSEVQSGNTVEVSLQGLESNRTFKGYYLQARNTNDAPIGMFNANTLAKTHSCGGIRGNAAHHANSEEKDRITVSWIAPKGYKGDVTFTATFVETYVHFWTKVTAPVVRVV